MSTGPKQQMKQNNVIPFRKPAGEQYRAVFYGQGKTFRTHAASVTKEGMKLTESIPRTMLSQNCRVVVSREDLTGSVEFMVHIVGLPDPKGVSFKFTDKFARHEKTLEDWIANPNKADEERAAKAHAREMEKEAKKKAA